MHSIAARSWDNLAGNAPAARRPGISLLERDELDLLEALDLDAAGLADVLAVKAIFGGVIVAEE